MDDKVITIIFFPFYFILFYCIFFKKNFPSLSLFFFVVLPFQRNNAWHVSLNILWIYWIVTGWISNLIHEIFIRSLFIVHSLLRSKDVGCGSVDSRTMDRGFDSLDSFRCLICSTGMGTSGNKQRKCRTNSAFGGGRSALRNFITMQSLALFEHVIVTTH